jgi:hypothetical protein
MNNISYADLPQFLSKTIFSRFFVVERKLFCDGREHVIPERSSSLPRKQLLTGACSVVVYTDFMKHSPYADEHRTQPKNRSSSLVLPRVNAFQTMRHHRQVMGECNFHLHRIWVLIRTLNPCIA